MNKDKTGYKCPEKRCGVSGWPSSTEENFDLKVEENDRVTTGNIKKVVNLLKKHAPSRGACLWYGVSPDTNRQNVLVWLPGPRRTVLCLDASGKSRIYCKGETVWHDMHGRLLRMLHQEKLKQQKPESKQANFHIDLGQEPETYVDKFCNLYTQALSLAL